MDFNDIKEIIQLSYDDVFNELNISSKTEIEKLEVMKTKDRSVEKLKPKKSKNKNNKD